MKGEPGRERSILSKVARFVAATSNRGFLLDLFAFVLNATLMIFLMRAFREMIGRASHGDVAAERLLFGMGVALFVLAPIGATLSRWQFHQRRSGKEPMEGVDQMGGCLFNPIFYFCLTAVIFAAVNAAILQTVYGKNEPDGGIFVGSILLGLVLMIVHTWLVYRFFTTPKNLPRSAFLQSRTAGFLGELCLFANMALFQLVWNLLGSVEAPRPANAFDLFGRILILLFVALLLYFPPRMFYLVDDIGKRRTWLMILLANTPILLRVLAGWGYGERW